MSLHDDEFAVCAKVIAPPLSLPELFTRCSTATGMEVYSPLMQQNYLLLDTTDQDHTSLVGQLPVLVEQLRLLPVPVIAIGAVTSTVLARGVDVVVPDVQSALAMINNINAHPLAAMTLVQLLRHNEDVSAEQGMFAESLAFSTLQGGADFSRVLTALPNGESVPSGASAVVLIERAGEELQITLNRPHARNAYNVELRDGLFEALQLLSADTSLKKAVIRGEGSCFCIGGDLREFGLATDTALAHAIRSTRSVGRLLLSLADRLEFRLHRACIGSGIEIPAFAARVVAEKNTFIQLPEITLGLIPGAGGTVSIPRRIGRHRAGYLALSARRINAATACDWGLVDALA